MDDELEEIFAFDPLVAGTMRLGNWGAKYDTAQYRTFIEACIALGVHDFDHADIYGDYTTEAEFGAVFKDNSSLRDQIRLISKCGIKMISSNRSDHKIKSYDLGHSHIEDSVDQSLRNLETDRLDVLLLHRPDVLMDPYEIAETFYQLREKGKVLHFGVSNFTTAQFRSLNSVFPLITNQIEVSAVHLNAYLDGTINQCMDHHIQPLAWSPLGGGELLGKPTNEKTKRLQDQLKQLGSKYSCGIDQLLYAFVLQHPAGIVPVLGTSRVDRIKSAVEALEINLNKEDWYSLWIASTGEEVA